MCTLQITDLCEVSIPENLQPSAATTNGNASVTDGCGKGARVETAAAAAAVSLTQTATASSKTNNELICLDESDVGGVGNKLDGFSLDDINDDDFNPRANSEDSEEDSEEVRGGPPPQSAPPQVLSPPLPPPALPPRVASNNSQNGSSNLTSTPTFTKQAADNIFSSNPFSVGDGNGGVDPFGMSAFQSTSSGALKSDKSPFAPPSAAAAVGQNFFDDLDPLRK